MIEVGNLTKVERQIFEVAVIRILLNENYFAGLDRFQNAICDRGLARTCSAGNANDQAHKKRPVFY